LVSSDVLNTMDGTLAVFIALTSSYSSEAIMTSVSSTPSLPHSYVVWKLSCNVWDLEFEVDVILSCHELGVARPLSMALYNPLKLTTSKESFSVQKFTSITECDAEHFAAERHSTYA
jgi:hypothetical protein